MNKEQNLTPFLVGKWLVDPATNRIRKNNRVRKLEPRVMEVLCYMAARSGMVITREHLERDVWAGADVDQETLTATMINLHQALRDDPRNPKYIEILPKEGYRFIAKVSKPAARNKTPVTNKSPGNKGLGVKLLLLLAVMAGALALTWQYMGKTSTVRAVDTKKEIPQISLPDKPSIVVLPFSTISQENKKHTKNNRGQDYFAIGFTDDLTTDLAGLSSLYVIARRSANIYRGKNIEAKIIGKELNVKYLVEGSVQKSGARIRINTRLIDAMTGNQLWVQKYDRNLKDVFTVQDDISKKIIAALKITLTTEEQKRVTRRYTSNLKAYEIFLKAQSLLARQTRDNNKTARKLFLDAIEIDPGFARAYSGLSLSHANDFRFQWTDDQTKAAKEALNTGKIAISLDKHSPLAHWVLGYIYLFAKEDHDSAIKTGLRTIELEPNYANGLIQLAVTYLYSGQAEKSLALVEKAKRLNPYYPPQYPSVLGLANLLLGNYQASVKAYQESIEINSGHIQPNVYLVASYHQAGQTDGAVWQIEQIRLNFPFFELDQWIARQPFRDPEVPKHIISSLHEAGLN